MQGGHGADNCVSYRRHHNHHGTNSRAPDERTSPALTCSCSSKRALATSSSSSVGSWSACAASTRAAGGQRTHSTGPLPACLRPAIGGPPPMPRAERGGARGVVAAAAAAPAGSTGTVETGLEAVGEEPRTRSFTIFVRAVNILTPKDVRGSSLQVWGSTTASWASRQ
jgi:hypothetical protein